MYQIYKIAFENGQNYVGQTIQGIEKRCKPCNYYYNDELTELFNKYTYSIEVLEEVETKWEADDLEKQFIALYGSPELNKDKHKRSYYKELLDMKRKIKIVNEEMTLLEAFEAFIQEKEANGLAASTIRNYTQSFGTFCEYNEFTATTGITEINEGIIIRWINHMRKEEISPSSMNHYIRDIRAFLNWCQKRDYIEKIEIREVKKQEEVPKFFKDEDLEKLLEKPRAKDSFVEWRTWAIVNTVLATGARASTISEMKISDVDFNKKEISLAHTKNKKAQNIPLSASLENVLREYMRKYGLTTYLFPNVGDEKLTINAISHSFSKYCRDREVEQTNIHGLRHSFARSWIKNGGSAFALQRILGHQNLTMTQRYVKLYAEDLKEDYEDFSALDVMKKKAKRTSAFKKG